MATRARIAAGITLAMALLAMPGGRLSAKDLADLLPGIKKAPAPDWAKAGHRLTYYSVVPAAGGQGYTLVDFLEVAEEGVMLSVQGWQKDPATNQVYPNAGSRAFQVCLGGGGDWWVHPKVLAKVEEVDKSDPETGGQFRAVRMEQKGLDGTARKVLRFEFGDGKITQVLAYDLESGVLFYKSIAKQGPDAPRHGRSNVILLMWFAGQRQMRVPWAGAPLHEGLVKGRKLRYEGKLVAIVEAANFSMPLPVVSDLELTAAGRTWFTYDQTTTTGGLRGMPAPAPVIVHLVSGTGQFDAVWIPPAALKALRAGQVLDRDPIVKETVSVKSSGGGGVVLSFASAASTTERTYDATSGLLTEVKTTGTVGLTRGVLEARLTRGALPAPKVQQEPPAEERPPARTGPTRGVPVEPNDPPARKRDKIEQKA